MKLHINANSQNILHEPSNNFRKNINKNLSSYFEGVKFQEAVESVVNQACKLLNAETAGVMLYDEQKQELVLQKPAFGDENDYRIGIYRVPIDGMGVGSTVFRTGTPFISNKPSSDPRVLQHIVEAYPTRNLITIPLEYNSRRIGVLHVTNKRVGDFGQEDLDLLGLVSTQLTLLLENAVNYEVEKKHTEELMKSYFELEKQQKRLQRLTEIHGKLVRSILNGEGLPAIIATLAELLNCQVIVEDRHFNIVCSAKNGINQEKGDIDAKDLLKSIKNISTIQGYLRETTAVEKYITVPAIPEEGIDYQRVLVPLADKYSILGYLSVLFKNRTLDEFDKIAIEQAALVASLELVKEKNVVEIETKLRAELIDDIIYGSNQDKERLFSRAGYINYNLSVPQSVAVVRIVTSSETSDDCSQYKIIKGRIMFLVNQILKDSIIVEKREDIVILTPASGKANDYYNKLKQVIHEVEEKCEYLRLMIGAGEFFSGIAKIKESYLQANRVLDVMEKFDFPDKVVSYDNLGIFNLLYSVNEPDLLRSFVDERIGALLNYDQKNDSSLVLSLECYLRHASIKEAAQELTIHVRTMKYRLKKAEEILGVDLKNTETSLALNIAIKVDKIINQQEGRANIFI
ncbi:MAG: GAF domain-containing protein [Clostridia bacterium]|jgi:purine catabolism regulator|nr:GAF domain-containing protein [Clostridia bacterium]